MGNKLNRRPYVHKRKKVDRLRNVASIMREAKERKHKDKSLLIESHLEERKSMGRPVLHNLASVRVTDEYDNGNIRLKNNKEYDKSSPACNSVNLSTFNNIIDESNMSTNTVSVYKTNNNNAQLVPGTEIPTASSIDAEKNTCNLYQHGKCPYEVEGYDKNVNYVLTGRRIIDIQTFLDKLKAIADHNSLFNCGLSSIQLVSEYRNGLFSRLNLQCMMCHKKFQIEAAEQSVNKDAVAGMLASGGGYIQLKQFAAAVDLPPISEKNFLKLQDQVADEWQQTAAEEMNKAAQIEREAAIKEGRVNKDGIAVIDVIVDGCWCRRSYQTNYSANSGCAAIIGRRTSKVLYMAVKNKYCCICQRNDMKDHICFKNYNGSSTGMEATIIAEGFKKSIEIYNIIYGRFIADGDSSTYSKIIESRPYNNITVEKINCRNHILRRFCTNMQKLTTDTRYPIKDRKLITKSKILSARKYICDSIKLNKPDKNCDSLHFDLNNSVYHAFGKHSKCKKDICSYTDDNIMPFYASSLWNRIKILAANVASHSRSLIEDVDSNIVEQFNGVVAKLVGGKRINYSQRRGYQTRCAGAVISFNTGKLLSTVHRNLHKNTPRKSIKRHEETICKKRARNRLAEKKKKRHVAKCRPSDRNYGENAEQPAMDPETFRMAKSTFLKNLERTDMERAHIEKQTTLQSECGEWLELRRNLLTASNFGKVIKRRVTNSCKNVVKSMLYGAPIDHVSSIQHGRQYEAVALEQLSTLENIKIQKCGLFIDEVIPYLGATPDGITDDMVVEVKCPIAPFKIGIDDAIDKKKIHFWKRNKNGQISVNKRSDWFFQAQGQMHITKKVKCLLAVWYGNNKLKVEILEKDDEFWRKEMEPKLISFYVDCLLPELVDPLYPSTKMIREPDYVRKRTIQDVHCVDTATGSDAPVLKSRKLDFSQL